MFAIPAADYELLHLNRQSSYWWSVVSLHGQTATAPYLGQFLPGDVTYLTPNLTIRLQKTRFKKIVYKQLLCL